MPTTGSLIAGILLSVIGLLLLLFPGPVSDFIGSIAWYGRKPFAVSQNEKRFYFTRRTVVFRVCGAVIVCLGVYVALGG